MNHTLKIKVFLANNLDSSTSMSVLSHICLGYGASRQIKTHKFELAIDFRSSGEIANTYHYLQHIQEAPVTFINKMRNPDFKIADTKFEGIVFGDEPKISVDELSPIQGLPKKFHFRLKRSRNIRSKLKLIAKNSIILGGSLDGEGSKNVLGVYYDEIGRIFPYVSKYPFIVSDRINSGTKLVEDVRPITFYREFSPFSEADIHRRNEIEKR